MQIKGRYQREPNFLERIIAGILVATSAAALANLLSDGSLLGIDGTKGVAIVTPLLLLFWGYAKNRRIGFDRNNRS